MNLFAAAVSNHAKRLEHLVLIHLKASSSLAKLARQRASSCCCNRTLNTLLPPSGLEQKQGSRLTDVTVFESKVSDKANNRIIMLML